MLFGKRLGLFNVFAMKQFFKIAAPHQTRLLWNYSVHIFSSLSLSSLNMLLNCANSCLNSTVSGDEGQVAPSRKVAWLYNSVW